VARHKHVSWGTLGGVSVPMTKHVSASSEKWTSESPRPLPKRQIPMRVRHAARYFLALQRQSQHSRGALQRSPAFRVCHGPHHSISHPLEHDVGSAGAAAAAAAGDVTRQLGPHGLHSPRHRTHHLNNETMV